MGKQIPLLMMAVALSVSSCGGGADEPAPREAAEISKARLIERADPACREDQVRLEARLKALPPATPETADSTALARVFEANAQTILAGARRIEALGTPSADAKLLEDYLDERTTAGNALRSAAQAARAGDFEALRGAIQTYGRNEAQQLGIRFGFKACGLGATKFPTQPRG